MANPAANAPPGSFMAHLAERRQWGLTASFRGICAESMRVDIRFVDTPQNRLDAYASSRAGRDLPIAEPMAALRPVLERRCPQLQVLRVTFESAITAKKYGYEGTMQRSEGWALRDGAVATTFDRSANVAIRITDFYGRVRLEHDGRCEDEPTLLIEPVNARVLDTDVSLITNYTALAESVATQYAQQCRAVKQIRFALGRMPLEYRCKDAGDCFLEATPAEGRWSVSMAQLVPRVQLNPIATFEDMAEVLAAGRFDVLYRYDSFFSFFVASFFEAFSEECRGFIRDPVGRTIRSTTVKRDGTVEHSDTKPIIVERAHAWAYDRHYDGAMAYMFNVLMGMPRGGGGSFEAGARAGASMVKSTLAHRASMNRLLRGQCTGERVEVIRQNMLARAASQPAAVTGRFTTAKQPVEAFDPDGASAPVFVEAYRRERSDRAINDAAARAEAERRPPAAPTPTPAGTPPTAGAPAAPAVPAAGANVAELQQQYIQAMAQLDQEYRTQLQQSSNPFTRAKLEVEFRIKRSQLEGEHRERLRNTTR
ncbi:MAG: hypothetical protein U5L03_05985 [Burkholderiaceae bacterium]|nr:hypothetical protein [Burkholderiaceae bacterium]